MHAMSHTKDRIKLQLDIVIQWSLLATYANNIKEASLSFTGVITIHMKGYDLDKEIGRAHV